MIGAQWMLNDTQLMNINSSNIVATFGGSPTAGRLIYLRSIMRPEFRAELNSTQGKY